MRAKPPTAPPAAFMEALGHSVADKRLDILRGIGRGGSISQAARDAGVSYKAAWQAVATLTNLAGVPLVDRAVGGAGGGGARLTEDGRRLVAMADAFAQARRSLHAPAAGAPGAGAAMAGLSIRTSMRNQLPARVAAIAPAGRMVTVMLDIGTAPQRLRSRVTRESAELLGLAPGLPVLALCKATAVEVRAASEPAGRAGNALEGVAAELTRDAAGDEVGVQLVPDGLQLVGFAPAGVRLRRRQRVRAGMDEAAVVIALPG
ncbi:MAG: TOBE domain-containing protein [Xenophilus sp.]